MIRTFRHGGLQRLYEADDRRGVRPDQAEEIARILARLDESESPGAMDLPGYRLHPLKGALKGFWAVNVSANLRIVFRFDGGDAHDVDLIDDH